MASVKLNPFIQSISGRIGSTFFRTCASGKVIMTTNTPAKRTSMLSPAEIQARETFKKRALFVRKLAKEYPAKSTKELWKLAKQIDETYETTDL